MNTQIRIQPELIIMIGTSAGQIGWRIKKLLTHAYGNLPVVRYLWVDIDSDINPLARPWFSSAERVELSGLNPAAVIQNLDNHPTIKEWWPDTTRIKPAILGGGGSPRQMRLIGRMAFFRKFNDRTHGVAFIDRLKAATDALFQIQNIRDTQDKSTPEMAFSVEAGCRVVLIFSPCGGTGGSMAFDIAYLCRHLLKGKDPTIMSINVLPPVIDRAIQSETHLQQEKIRANAYAWLKEDNYLSENPYWNVTYPEGGPLNILAQPFDYRFVIDIANQAGYRLNSTDDVYNMIGQAIFMDTGSSIGGAMRGFTANVAALSERFEGMRRMYSSLAAAALIFPKARLLDYCASRAAQVLLDQGFLAKPDHHLVSVAASTLMGQLRLRDTDLLSDFMACGDLKMQYEPSIQKADSVAAAVAQIDAQETQNQMARRSAGESLEEYKNSRLVQLKEELDREITKMAATRGLSFACAVLEKLQAAAPSGLIDPEALSLDGLKARIHQQGCSEMDLEAARRAYEKTREALRQLDNGIEDVLERLVSANGWKKKFSLDKHDCLAAMAKINENTLQLSAQQHAANIYDEIATLAGELRSKLTAASIQIRLSAAAFAASAEKQTSKNGTVARGYEFLQEIEIDFAEYYREQSKEMAPASVFQDVISARALANMDTWVSWLSEELPAAVEEYARHFFSAGIEGTSLMAILRDKAEKQGIEPSKLIQEQLDHLVEYCHPFWEYDTDRGLNDLEGKSIIGVEDENSPLIPEAYRNGLLYEIKTTGFRDRIDVVRIQHGLPAFLIRGMDEYKEVYERLRKGDDPLHILPGMEFAPDLMPELGKKNREMFAISLIYGYIVQVGNYYYYDPEKAYNSHKIQPSREYRLAQGREKAEEVFSHKDEWVRKVGQMVDSENRSMGNEAAIRKLEEAIEGLKSSIAKMSPEDSLRKQFEKEIAAAKNLQRTLGKIG